MNILGLISQLIGIKTLRLTLIILFNSLGSIKVEIETKKNLRVSKSENKN